MSSVAQEDIDQVHYGNCRNEHLGTFCSFSKIAKLKRKRILCLRFLIYVYVYLISNVEMLRSDGYILYISGCLLLFVAIR